MEESTNRRKLAVYRAASYKLRGFVVPKRDPGDESRTLHDAMRDAVEAELRWASKPQLPKKHNVATLPPDEPRHVFARILFQLAPEVSQELGSEQGLSLRRQFDDAWHEAVRAAGIYDDTPVSEISHESLTFHQPYVDAREQLARFVESWQSRFNLLDDWHWDYAMSYLWVGDWYARAGVDYLAPINPGGMTTIVHKHPLNVADLVVCKLEDPEEQDDDGGFGDFDPREESVANAARRLMPALRARLEYLLNDIVRQDVEQNGAVAAYRFDSFDKFRWLIQYQVLRYEWQKIARSESKTPRQVERAAREVARLIGMTVRPKKLGRPPRRRANTRKIRH